MQRRAALLVAVGGFAGALSRHAVGTLLLALVAVLVGIELGGSLQ